MSWYKKVFSATDDGTLNMTPVPSASTNWKIERTDVYQKDKCKNNRCRRKTKKVPQVR